MRQRPINAVVGAYPALDAFACEAGGFFVVKRAPDFDAGQARIEFLVVGERADELAVEAAGALIEVDQDVRIVFVGVWHFRRVGFSACALTGDPVSNPIIFPLVLQKYFEIQALGMPRHS